MRGNVLIFGSILDMHSIVCSSYHYCRRQYNLVDDPLLRYSYLNEFERSMIQVVKQVHALAAEPAHVALKHEDDKVISFERAGLVWIFNFHPHKSYSDYRIPVNEPGTQVGINPALILSSCSLFSVF